MNDQNNNNLNNSINENDELDSTPAIDHLKEFLERPVCPADNLSYSKLQKTALNEILAISRTKMAPSLAQIFEKRDTAEYQAKKSLENNISDISSKYNSKKSAIEKQYKIELQELSDKYDNKISSLENRINEEKYVLKTNASAAMKQLKEGNEYEKLSIETSCQAIVTRCNQDKKETDEAMPKVKEHIAEIKDTADWLLNRYRINGTTLTAASFDKESITEPDKTFRNSLESAKTALKQSENLKLCKLFIGVLPLLSITIISFLAFGICWLLTQIENLNLPPFALLGTAVTVGTFIASALGSVFLWKKGKNKALPLYQEIINKLAICEAALDARYQNSMTELETQKTQAKDSAAQQLLELLETHNDTIKKLQTEAESKIQELEKQHGKELSELKNARQQILEDVENRHTKLLEANENNYKDETAKARETFVALEQQYLEEYDNELEKIKQKWRQSTAVIQSLLDQQAALPASTSTDWSDPEWENWHGCENLNKIRIGDLEIDTTSIEAQALTAGNLELPSKFKTPAVLSFPDNCSLLIHTKRSGRDKAIELLKATTLRLFTSLPAGRVHFTILDPVGLGENFAGFMHAADYEDELIGGRIWTSPAHIREQLEDLTAHMENVIQKYLRNEFQTIEEYNRQAGELAEPYRFLVIADFPQNFTEESAKYLKSIINSGARCGVYTLIAFDSRQELPGGIDLDDLKAGALYLKYQDERFIWQDDTLSKFTLTTDTPPAEEIITDIMHKVGQAGKDSLRVEVPFTEIAPKEDNFWKGDNGQELVIPIGRTGATRLQYLRLGKGVAQHILIAGKTGSGKSTLLHVIVSAMASCYSPDEVELYLIDFKKGVEFKCYAENNLPHARVVAIESDREFGLSVLTRLDEEMTKRGNDFRNAGVQDIAGYRQVTGQKLPRCILIVDEFQIFFAEDDRISQDAGLMLEQLVRQGRAFGIHIILGSQTLGGAASLARSTIGQMAVRIAMQCSESDSQLILDDDNTAARLLNRPGEAIYNDNSGMVAANSPFQTAWINDSVRDHYTKKAVELAVTNNINPQKMIVFEGNAPANIADNKILADLQAGNTSANQLSPVAWLGEPVSIKPPTAVTFHRQSGTNLLITGQREDCSLGIILAAMQSLAAQVNNARFMIFDGSPAGSTTEGKLATEAEKLNLDFVEVPVKSVADALDAISQELNERTENDATDAPAVFNIIYGLHRYRILRKGEDDFSFSMDSEAKPKPDKQFAEILREGPVYGIHTIVWTDTLASLERSLDRSTIREFDNRVLFQMSMTDSSNLIDSPAANTLGYHRALFYSEEQGITEKFRPYR